jgi:SNW domain-containing protein 1
MSWKVMEVDSRLYNQSAGMDSGFGADDGYNAFSKHMTSKS